MRAIPLIIALLAAAPATAALAPGAKAPNFTTQGALAGKPFNVTLANLLKKGPVVLYFFPAAFTPGCTAEAHEFAEKTALFKQAGATVLGIAADKIEDLQRFSVEECRNKFAVAVGTPAIIKGYDVVLPQLNTRSSRTSYVIAPNGQIIYAYSDMDYRNHVANTLKAVQSWKESRKR
ncbi:peroxiredoxin [Aquisediminimonas profunda]|uniref:peroxiredoxin n=1 Tax=Aquisediminimonas profunda TaxID=1550733 RepID=UPI001C632A24|nr:peroxiredoxin [Aquisediminimonas profunda]